MCVNLKRGQHLGIERDLLAEYRLFCKRHIRYAPIFLCIYGYSLSGWTRTRPLRAAYALTQAVDDLLDGDRPCAGEPEDAVREILGYVNHTGTIPFLESEAGKRITRIWNFARPHLESCGALQDFERLAGCMLLDRRRVREGLRHSQAELARHHRTVFECSANVALKIGGFELRASDVPGVIDELCWVSPMRDLREDLRAGLNNLPVEVYATRAALADPALEALQDPAVLKWLKQEYEAMLETIERTESQLLAVRGRTGASGFRIFHKLLSNYAKKYPARYPEVFR